MLSDASVSALSRGLPGPDRPARGEAVPLQPPPDHRSGEDRLLRRPPALGVLAILHGLRRRICFAQRGYTRDQPLPSHQLLELWHRVDRSWQVTVTPLGGAADPDQAALKHQVGVACR
jgi:hypothetical protein